MDFSKQYFTIIGASRPNGLAGFVIGPVMTEQEIVAAIKEQAADIIPAEQSYDGEQLDAALEFLNDDGRIFEIFECETDAERYIERAGEFGGDAEARQVASGWLARKATLKAAVQ